jgi:thiol-disulfide isomerase/thioredoxin
LRRSDLQGKVVLIDFWATWCSGCVEELPAVQKLYEKYKDQGFMVIGVHSKQGGDKAEASLKEHKVTFPVVVDDDTSVNRYAVSGWPTYFLVDRQGKVTLGFLDTLPTNEQIEALLKASSTAADTTVKEPEPPKIYDADAVATQQIAEALAKAGQDNKRVLLQFGANWCGWCQKLHTLFQTDPEVSAKIKSDYVVVLIDVDKDRNADVTKRYGQPTRFGLPAIVLLDADGNQLTTKDTSELEEGDHHSPEKVMAFLQEWSPKK